MLKNGQLLKLLKSIHVLTDSGDYRHAAISNGIRNDLKMSRITGDSASFVSRTPEGL